MKPIDILRFHQLKRTACREGILSAILSANKALSEEEVKSKVEGNYDRTTFYRSFKTLIENNVLHKIVVDEGLVKYAITIVGKTPEHHHAHFVCKKCHTVSCLDAFTVKVPNLPVGYQTEDSDLLIKGVCKSCIV